jgi:hypothetical protein
MNQSTEKVLSYLTGNGNLDAVSVDELQKLAAENPYFPVTHFLLAKKLKAEKASEYSQQGQKASLYFSNPHWLQYQLSEDKFDDEPLELVPPILASKENEASIFPGNLDTEDKNKFSNAAFSNNVTSITSSSGDIEVEQTETNSLELENTAENIAPPLITTPAESEHPQLAGVAQAEEEMAALTRDTNEETQHFIDHLDSSNTTPNTIETTLPDNLSAAAETEVVELEEEMAGVTHGTNTETQTFLEETEHLNGESGQTVEDDEHDIMFRNIKAMLDATSEEADADTKDAVVPMDPYYTIDYFASQGIKLELDKNPQDQLGQNLKKFTHWLRHMKKLGPEDATEAINRTESEADIQQIADSSNTVREVVTEAMALVLEKQGKKEKAIELYNKLSFLYPHKNAYFADKIKKLKGI